MPATRAGSNPPIYLSSGGMVLLAFIVIAVLWVGWQVIALTASLNAPDPEVALAWTPTEASALDELANREITKPDGDLSVAKSLAERALRANPLDARALSMLALIAERTGDQARADKLMNLSAARTWRDVGTQAWLLKRNIEKGEFDKALLHVDALLRTNPAFFEMAFPVLSAFTIDKRTFEALAKYLVANPPWRLGVLDRLSGQSPDTGRLVELYDRLKASEHPPTAKELRPYLDRLIRDGRLTDAYQSWRETLPPERRGREFYLYNSNFDVPIDGLPFNWRLEPILGVNIQLEDLPDTKSRAIHLQFSGTRVGQFKVGQLMLLPPGDYRLTGRVRAEELRTQRGLEWHIFCAQPTNSSLARTSLVAAPTPWTTFEVDFTVPPQGCVGQWMQLEIPSRTASERQIEGQVWYEKIAIERAEGPTNPL